MENDPIDCSGFEDFGIPSPLECWKHQAHLLASEVGNLQKEDTRVCVDASPSPSFF